MTGGSATGVREQPSGGEIVRLWAGLLGPPIVFLVELSVNYALANWACTTARPWVLDLVTVVALLFVAVTTFIAWREWKAIGQTDAGETVRGRRTLMAIGGMTNGAFFAIVILATAIPNFVLRGCP